LVFLKLKLRTIFPIFEYLKTPQSATLAKDESRMQKSKILGHNEIEINSHINRNLAVKKENMIRILENTCDFNLYAQKPDLLEHDNILQGQAECIQWVYVGV